MKGRATENAGHRQREMNLKASRKEEAMAEEQEEDLEVEAARAPTMERSALAAKRPGIPPQPD